MPFRLYRFFLPRRIRRRLALKRRGQNHRNAFEDGKKKILEVRSEFEEWQREWIHHRDQLARRSARAKLRELHALIRRVGRSNHRQEFEAFLRRQNVPGWRRTLSSAASRRR